MYQDQGNYSPEAGRTWPDWKVLRTGTGDMVTVRSDSVAFSNTSMRLGTIFIGPDGGIWEFALYTEGDPLQGGVLFKLSFVRESK